MEKFFLDNSSAIFSLLGISIGAILTFCFSWLIKKREYELRLWDKLIERRVNAHEKVIGIALELRVFVLFDGIDSKGEAKRYPKILHSEDTFNEWLCKFADVGNNSSTWLSVHAKREINYAQDYLLTLNNNIKNIPPEKLHEFGNLIRNDFIE